MNEQSTIENQIFKLLSKKAYRYDYDKIKNELTRLRSGLNQKAIQFLY
jgi:hypothetical protein